MNKIATASFTTEQIPLPSGAVPAGYLAWLTRGNSTTDMQNLPAEARSCTFLITQPGTYVVRVVRVLEDGSSIGNAAESDPFVVTAEMVDVPVTVTVVVGDAVAAPAGVKVRVK